MSEEQDHSPFGGSKAHIWTVCSKSVEEAAKWPAAPSSEYAEKGTDEHTFAAHCLTHGDRDASGYIGATMERKNGTTFIVNAGIIKAVQVYLNDAWAHIGPADEYFVEQQFCMPYSNLLRGHNDLIAYRAEQQELWLWDYKGGAGIYVEAEGNLQLAFYMAGALYTFMHRPLQRVVMTIVQPNYDRAEPIRRWTIPIYEALDWSVKFEDAYKLANSDQATWVPGDHCRFCAGAAGCDALHLKALEGCMDGPAVVTPDPKQMTALELGHRLRQAELIELWIKTLRERAFSEAIAGRPPDGFKLIDKRGQRKWHTGYENLRTTLAQCFSGVPHDQLFPPGLVSPAQLEKIVGKAELDRVAVMINSKGEGQKLVPDDHPAEERKHGIAGDFGDIIDAGD